MSDVSLLSFMHASRGPVMSTLEGLFSSGEVTSQMREYYEVLSQAGETGRTDGEMAQLMELPRSTVSARRNGLNKWWISYCDKNSLFCSKVLVVDSGETRQNPGARSRPGRVWKINKLAEGRL